MRGVAFIVLLCACSCVFVDAFVASAQTCTALHHRVLGVRLHAQTPESSKRSKKVMDAAGFAKLTQRLQAEAVREQNTQAIAEEASSSSGAAVARYAAISAALFAPLFFGSPLLQRPALAVSHEAVAQGE
jgi:hypothetical protein